MALVSILSPHHCWGQSTGCSAASHDQRCSRQLVVFNAANVHTDQVLKWQGEVMRPMQNRSLHARLISSLEDSGNLMYHAVLILLFHLIKGYKLKYLTFDTGCSCQNWQRRPTSSLGMSQELINYTLPSPQKASMTCIQENIFLSPLPALYHTVCTAILTFSYWFYCLVQNKTNKQKADLRGNCTSQKQHESLGNGKTSMSAAKHKELEVENSSSTKALLTSQQLMQLISARGFSFNQRLHASQCAPKQYARRILPPLSSFLNICCFNYFVD